MIPQEQAVKIAQAWIDAWNRHDIEAIMEHYADTIEFTSPLVVERLNRENGTITRRKELRSYFMMGLGATPRLHFELVDVIPGVGSLVIHYRNQRGRAVAEFMQFDGEGRAVRCAVHYR